MRLPPQCNMPHATLSRVSRGLLYVSCAKRLSEAKAISLHQHQLTRSAAPCPCSSRVAVLASGLSIWFVPPLQLPSHVAVHYPSISTTRDLRLTLYADPAGTASLFPSVRTE